MIPASKHHKTGEQLMQVLGYVSRLGATVQ